MLNNYLTYLNYITNKLNKFFDKQKDYIFCKRGCALCCKDAEFPYSAIEMQYLLQGFNSLEKELKNKIEENVKEILEKKKAHKEMLKKSVAQGVEKSTEEKRFVYDCPFLINNVCSIYEYRGLVCHSFGLMALPDSKHEKVQVPFCCYKGLNYSNVMDPNGDKISSEMYRKSGIKEKPASFNVSYETLTNNNIEEVFNFKFGTKKPMIEWFEPEDQKPSECQTTQNKQNF